MDVFAEFCIEMASFEERKVIWPQTVTILFGYNVEMLSIYGKKSQHYFLKNV